jgi:hypothetical protein
MVVMTTMMPRMPARSEVSWLKVEANNTTGNVHPGLALQAERLKREGIGRTAEQQVAAAAQPERDVAAHAAVVAGEIAAADALGWRVHSPSEAGFGGNAEIDTEAGHMRKIRLRTTAVGVKNAFKGRRGSDHHANVLAAVALQNADLNTLLLSLG